ncbi:TonB-dependent receptor [Ferruginibacter albus]|uniref:TonB-dependent receptor n=1 Tax=Ferruginibacter albus TaxID=2875540 RepID=UPI001CC70DB5|nr:TonB-dependent receptor [Ferruginibacter albus]UAY52199.1 TonB-dependent receptor [Ferruginibacter albus]
MKKYLLLFLSLTFCWIAKAQLTFSGIVFDSSSHPIQGVSISIHKKIITISDSAGNFSFSDSLNSLPVSFTHSGFDITTKTIVSDQKDTIFLNQSNTLLAGVTVNAYEQNTRLINIPVSVAVLSKADLERYNDASLVAPINTVPGVKMDERSPGSYRLSIRGNLLRSPFSVRNVKVYWNGIPFTDANGNTYLQQLGFTNIGKIEILKGSGGSMYGAGTDGVVLLTSQTAAKNENSLSVNSLAGSYGTFSSGVTYLNGTDKSNSALSFSHLQSDGYRTQTAMRRDVANYTGNFSVTEKQSVKCNILYSDLYYQTPGGLTLAQMLADPKQARSAGGGFPGAVAQQAAIFVKTFYGGLSHAYKFNEHWDNTTSVYTSSTHFSNPTIRNYERRTEQGYGGRTITQYQQENFKLNFGGEYQYTFTNTRTFANNAGNIDTLMTDQEIDASIYNIFIQASVTLPKNVIINAGLSYNNYHYNFLQVNTLPAINQGRNFDPELIPRISILKKINAGFSTYLTVSKGFSPPSIAEVVASDGIFNKTLNAEDGMNYEIGARGDIIKNKLSVDASFYISGLNNTIVSRTDSAGAQHFVNEGKTDQHGIELAVIYYPIKDAAAFLKTLKLWSNYTFIYARFDEYSLDGKDYSGNKLPGTAPNVFVLGADIETTPGLYGNFTYSYTDKIALDDANTFFAKQYNLLSGRVGYKKNLSKLLQSEIYIAFDNSFNTPYSLGNDLNAAGNRFFNPSAPKNFYGGLKLKFNL